MKNELNTCFQQKFATGSYGVGIGCAWCSRKACEICSSLAQKKKWKKLFFFTQAAQTVAKKLVDCYLGACVLCEEKYIFFIFLFVTSELHISQAFREHQACPIPTPYEPVVNFCWKWVLSSFFLYFSRSSYMQPCGWNCPRAEGQGAKKEVCFARRILVFHFFSLCFFAHGFAWRHLQFNFYNQSVKFLVFFKKFYKVHSVEVLSQDPCQKKEF
jgi:hypothetical protein